MHRAETINPRAARGDRAPRPAFSLIELMVVVAIIALLVGIMLPSFHNVRQQAKVTKTVSLFQALEAGNEQFKADRQIGGTYIPSATDSPTFGQLQDPLASPAGSQTVGAVAGASLLVYGLAGADALGTPGFRDLNRDGSWWDDQHNGAGPPAGSYYLDPSKSMEPAQPRYGPYLSDKGLDAIVAYQTLKDEGSIVDAPGLDAGTGNAWGQKVFVDAWNHPVLYYRAQRAGRQMLTDASVVGIYNHRDNRPLTGDQAGGGFGTSAGPVDFGAGTDHGISANKIPDPDPATDDVGATAFDDTFARFIWDSDVTQRNVPVNRETYLLISAGPDALYGTTDDVVNWTPK